MNATTRSLSLLAVSPLAFALAMASAQAAERVDLHQLNVGQVNKQYHAAAAKLGLPAQANARHAELLGLDADSGLQVLTSATDRDGTKHYRYQQTFRGVPVFGEQVIVSEGKDGNVRNLFGRKVEGLSRELASASAKVTKGQALSIAKNATLGSKLMAMRVENEKAEQMIYVDDHGRAHMALRRLVLRRQRQAAASPTRPFVIVDANSGKVLKQWDGLTNALVGTGPGGNTKTGQYEWGSGGMLRLPGRDPERHHLHDEQHQREVGEPQRRHRHQHHRVLVHLPAQHLQDHQRRLLADQRRALLRRRDHPACTRPTPATTR